ncbi:uncharacterized protein LOC106651809 [Trichogramma pretiosum]|uniref:uncharacterized protein LOC106651809 n=1 Tax=Trichogramma pretiosum TaxID=7493 RepID=UPI0006C95418|nr:uncharacterized protein LOC106651809 [Trichogramma pretiosum]
MYKFGSPATQNYVYDNWLKHALNILPLHSNREDDKSHKWKKFTSAKYFNRPNEASDDEDNISQFCVSGSEMEEGNRVSSRKSTKNVKNQVSISTEQYVDFNVKELRKDAEKMKILGKMFKSDEADATGQFLLNSSPASTYTRASSSRTGSVYRSTSQRYSHLQETSDGNSSSCTQITTPRRCNIKSRKSRSLDSNNIDMDMDFSAESFLQVNLVESASDRIIIDDCNNVSLLELIDGRMSYDVPKLKSITEADLLSKTDLKAKTATKKRRLAAKRPAARPPLPIRRNTDKRPSWMEPIIIELNGIRTYNYNYLPGELPKSPFYSRVKRLSEESSSDDESSDFLPSKKQKCMPSSDFFDSLRLVVLSSESDDEKASRLPESSSESSSTSCSTCSTCSLSSSSSSESD